MKKKKNLYTIIQTSFRRPIQTLVRSTATVRKLLNVRNFRTLIKALREEPPDLILENLLQFLRRGKGQTVYTNKFLNSDVYLKVYLLECRIEAGVLNVVVWTLAKRGIYTITLGEGGRPFAEKPDYFIKPELSALFSAFSDYEQQGFIFQIPFRGTFHRLELQLTDPTDHQITIPIGKFFQYPIETTAATPLPDFERNRLVVLLHDWAPTEFPGLGSRYQQLQQLTDGGIRVLFCPRKQVDPEKWRPLPSGVEMLIPENLPQRLQELNFDYLCFLSVDTIVPFAFYHRVLAFCDRHPGADILYFDADLYADGALHSPSLKPDYSPEYLAAANYIGSDFCVSRELGQKLDWFSEGDFASGGYDFLLRSMAHTTDIHRLSELRLHRPEAGLVAEARKEAAEIHVRTRHFTKRGGQIKPGLVPGSSEVLLPLKNSPLVSIIIPFKDQINLLDQCLQSILAKTAYPNWEVLLVSNNSEQPETFDYLEKFVQVHRRFRWLKWDNTFNYSKVNNWAADRVTGEFVLLLNNDTEIISRGWISRMLSFFAEEGVGAVGAKLLYPDLTVQHAGIVVGIGGIAAHAHKHYPDQYGSYDGRANKVQNVSACTAACLLVQKSVFLQVGGLEEEQLPVAFNDVDLCLKIRRAGFRIVYTPFVKLYHYESISRGAENTPEKWKRAKKEIRFFRKKWSGLIRAGDPYYHPALSRRRADFEDASKMED